ncbi:MAG TPA: adenylate/guanylate cyclase domain-containing protein [Jatrophihabitantaceae bacterium]|nr:adenylate/guanylate cyclase domain-containing protein [Jatrophihabitantaceae bacterium]
MHPQTHYVDSGGVNIAYQVVGDGPIDLVFVPGFISHLDLQWTEPRVARFFTKLASFSRLILFDKRGTGLSDPVAAPPALEDRMEDVHAVMDAAGSERAALMGLSEGGPMSILYAATYPDRVTALILCGTYATSSLDPAVNPAAETWAELLPQVLATLDHWGEGRTLSLFAPRVDTARDRIARGLFERSAASPRMARMLLDANLAQTDVSALLPTIQVPTLVLHRESELVPLASGKHLADNIPGAKLVVLPGADHIPFYGDGDGYAEEIEEFLTGVRSTRVSDRVLTSVLFTDIVGSTERATGMGDAAWRELLGKHDEVVRREISEHRGRLVKTTGDGILATFDGPARGIRCATSISDALRDLGVEIRAGLHTGECELMGDDIGGVAVHIAARIAALGGPGEVLVSGVVTDLVAGSGITFSDRGTHELKGVPGRWHLHAVERIGESPGTRIVPDEREPWARDRLLIGATRKAPKLTQRLLAWSPKDRDRRSKP